MLKKLYICFLIIFVEQQIINKNKYNKINFYEKTTTCNVAISNNNIRDCANNSFS